MSTTATDDGTIQIRCHLCGAELGSLTVMSDDHEPLGPVHLGLSVDCGVCLRPALRSSGTRSQSPPGAAADAEAPARVTR